MISLLGFSICCIDPVDSHDFCQVELTEDRMKSLIYAVRNHYWYQMYIGM